jgi:hypothetical protein
MAAFVVAIILGSILGIKSAPKNSGMTFHTLLNSRRATSHIVSTNHLIK